MGFKLAVLALLLCLDIIRSTKVELFSKWKPKSGWEVECSWNLFTNDSLQSVRLYNNDQQFMIYRPERDGQKLSQNFDIHGNPLLVECAQTADRGVLGVCVLNVVLYQPPNDDFKYSCEVSGEGPMFRMNKKELTIHNYVPPSAASLRIITLSGSKQTPGRVTLNCTTSGLPAPDLKWTIGSQKVPRDFCGSIWNAETKLWQAWSLLSYTPTSERLDAICTPEVSTEGHLVFGRSAVYNKANGIYGTVGFLTVISLLLIALRQS